jgi:hypothetical protein
MWCVLELNLSIIGGSIPALKPFVLRFFPSLLGTMSGRSHDTSNAYHIDGSRSGRKGRYKANTTGNSTNISPNSRTNRLGGTSMDSEEYIMQDTSITKTVQYGYSFEEGSSTGESAKHSSVKGI